MTNNIEKFEYNNFTYSIDYSSQENVPKIIHKQSIPDSIFKFYSISKYNIEALSQNYLYASHPIELNDILDSSPLLLYSSRPISFEIYENFYKGIFNSKKELEDFYTEDVESNQCKKLINHMYNMSFNLLGIISLSERENNTLMWPHYTQERGFQIKFNVSSLLQSIQDKLNDDDGELFGFHPINYTNELKPIDVSRFRSFHIPTAYASNIKLNDWQYEKEWRIIASKKNMGIPYSKSGLNTIPDHIGIDGHRQMKYNFEAIEEISVGHNFITARDFEIEWIIDDKEFVITVKRNSDEQYIAICDFLDIISDKYSDKFYFSGAKYELNTTNEPYLIRTKEKMTIEKIEEAKYKLIRTFEIIRLLN